MTATIAGAPEGSHWRVALVEGSDTNSSINKEAHARAVVRNGTLSVTRTLPAVASPYFDVIAFGPGDVDGPHGRFCSVLVKPSAPFAGVTFCRQDTELSMVAFHRRRVGLVVRWALLEARPGTRWTATLSADTGRSGTSVVTRMTASPHGQVMGKVTFSDLANPRLRILMAADGGQRCSLSMRRVFTHPAPIPVTRPGTSGGVVSDRSARAELTRLLGVLVNAV